MKKYSLSSFYAVDIIEDTSKITNQESEESEESISEFNADEDSDSDFIPSPRVPKTRLRPKTISSESDDSSDENEESHNTKSKLQFVEVLKN